MISANDSRVIAKLKAAGHPEAVGKFVGCSRKKGYPNLIAAMTFARQTAPKDGSYRALIYKCLHCTGFHLTTKTANEIANPKAKKTVSPRAYEDMRAQRDHAISELVKVRGEYEKLKTAPAVFSEKKSWWLKLKEKLSIST